MSEPKLEKIPCTLMDGSLFAFKPKHYSHCEERIMPNVDSLVCRIYLNAGTSFLVRQSAQWVRQQVISWRKISG